MPKSPVFTYNTSGWWLHFRLPALPLNIPPRCALLRSSILGIFVFCWMAQYLRVGADRRVRPHRQMRDSKCLRSRRTKSQTANTGGRGSQPLHGIFVRHPPRKRFSSVKHPPCQSAKIAFACIRLKKNRKNLLLRFWLGSAALLLGWNRIRWNRFVFTALGCPPDAIVSNNPSGRSATC